METAVLNEILNITYPDGFHVMSEEELGNTSFYKEAPKWSISDPERHMIISLYWRENKGFFGKLADEKDVEETVEGKTRKIMKPFGYKLQDQFKQDMGSEEGEGFRFTYKVQDIEMTGETVIVQKDGSTYYFYSYYRTELEEDSRKTLDEIAKAIVWTEKGIPLI